MSYRIATTIVMILMLLLAGCNNSITGDSIKEGTIIFANETFPYEIAKLPELNLDSVERFEDYKTLPKDFHQFFKEQLFTSNE